MSVNKIEQDIKLLENELEDINNTISDPIERNEYIKELNKKLKKLRRTKIQIEQLEKEQQELESLKSEFTLSSNSLLEAEESETHHNISIESESKSEAEKIIPTTSSETIDTKIVSKDRKISNIPWIAILLLVIFGLGLTTTISIAWIFNSKAVTKIEEDRFTESANQEKIKTKQEINQARRKDNKVATNLSVINRNFNSSSAKSQPYNQYQYFNNYQFPRSSCGDKDPGGTNAWYPVFITDTERNINLVRNNFCRDAIRKYRQKKEVTSIQVASFTNKFKAEEFARLMQNNLGSGEVSEPTIRNLSQLNNGYSSFKKTTTSHFKQSKTGNLNLTIDDLADRTFYKRHPELQGRKIRSNESYLKQEWKQIRDCEATVDYLFYQRHPERQNTKIASYDKASIIGLWTKAKLFA